MAERAHWIAIDIGASSGRVILGRWDGSRVVLEELHRFPNGMIEREGHLFWEVGRLWVEVQRGLQQYAANEEVTLLRSIGIDTWAVDYGLLDAQGELIGDPFAYRDPRNNGIAEQVDALISPTELYQRTGLQRLPFNTLYQLYAERHSGRLERATALLLIPDLFHYWLTGQRVAEYTNASTTMFLDARQRVWATDLLTPLGIPTHILPPLVMPGTRLGPLRPELQADLGLPASVTVVAVGTHDTASAVAAVPHLDAQSAYISSGTWSLVGVERTEPLINDAARQLNVTNEGGVYGTIRLLKNVSGLWLLQECQRRWHEDGLNLRWDDIVAQAATAPPRRSLIDPDAPEFLAVGDMPARIRDYCRRTGQPEPETVGEIARCCLDSLALRYQQVIDALAELTGQTITTVRIVGGGSQNALLCQLTADACRRPVVAGPTEGTALGNILVQAIATGYLPNLSTARQVAAASVGQQRYEPRVG
ncbi:rhamnulokinase [Chloroflexus aggregans]|uniref:Carbohydrate kinase FGGY n=1 Tax=Chloroflexus aggregans (strain MD-66 / DSM 9485) TaxID=326427 RepID=B8G8B1_CHLAD|nr:rhamnulokinase family protein [Chloroflexus aggregans]ACL26165.1 carbohydrate kinase FGGY [Chloroflexus aggregans DSM 9485]